MDTDNVAIRLKFFMDSVGYTNSQFADACGIPRPSLSQIMSGRNKKISDVLVGMIHKAFPQLSVVWLLFGEGEMLNPLSENAENGSEDSVNPSDGPSQIEYSKENGVNGPLFGSQFAMNQMNAVAAKHGVKEELKNKNQRKVIHVTVYYDDSTFETFYPEK